MRNELTITKGVQEVGDVRVTTEVVIPTPELDKLREVAQDSQKIGAFLDWCQDEKRWELATLGEYERLTPICRSIQSVLAEYFDIDERKCEDEKRAILEAIRR